MFNVMYGLISVDKLGERRLINIPVFWKHVQTVAHHLFQFNHI